MDRQPELARVRPHSHALQRADAAAARAAMQAAEIVVSMTPYASEAMKACADVLLPMSPFTETA